MSYRFITFSKKKGYDTVYLSREFVIVEIRVLPREQFLKQYFNQIIFLNMQIVYNVYMYIYQVNLSEKFEKKKSLTSLYVHFSYKLHYKPNSVHIKKFTILFVYLAV